MLIIIPRATPNKITFTIKEKRFPLCERVRARACVCTCMSLVDESNMDEMRNMSEFLWVRVLCRAAHAASGSSQARGQMRAAYRYGSPAYTTATPDLCL